MHVPRPPFDSTPEAIHDSPTRPVENEDQYGDWVREWDEHVRRSEFPAEDELDVDMIASSTGDLAQDVISVESDVESFLQAIEDSVELTIVKYVWNEFESININVVPLFAAVANYNSMLVVIDNPMSLKQTGALCLLLLERISKGCLYEMGDEGSGCKYDELRPFIASCLRHLRDDRRRGYTYDERTVDKLQLIISCAGSQLDEEGSNPFYDQMKTMGLLPES